MLSLGRVWPRGSVPSTQFLELRQKDSKPDSGLCESSTICLKRRNGDKTEGWRKMVEGAWRAESR